jgi:hypothetical protein
MRLTAFGGRSRLKRKNRLASAKMLVAALSPDRTHRDRRTEPPPTKKWLNPGKVQEGAYRDRRTEPPPTKKWLNPGIM